MENGYIVRTVETLEKMAGALEVPLYALFYDDEAPPRLGNLPNRKTCDDIAWGSSGKNTRQLQPVIKSQDESNCGHDRGISSPNGGRCARNAVNPSRHVRLVRKARVHSNLAKAVGTPGDAQPSRTGPQLCA